MAIFIWRYYQNKQVNLYLPSFIFCMNPDSLCLYVLQFYKQLCVGFFLANTVQTPRIKQDAHFFIINQELIKITEQKNTECNKELWPIMPSKFKTYISVGTGKSWCPIYPLPQGNMWIYWLLIEVPKDFSIPISMGRSNFLKLYL